MHLHLYLLYHRILIDSFSSGAEDLLGTLVLCPFEFGEDVLVSVYGRIFTVFDHSLLGVVQLHDGSVGFVGEFAKLIGEGLQLKENQMIKKGWEMKNLRRLLFAKEPA